MSGGVPYREWEETYEVFQTTYRFSFRGPVGQPGRWEVAILDLEGVSVIPRRVRGRTVDEARWRAEEVLHTWAAVRRLHAAACRAAARATPGAEVVLNERADELQVELVGCWSLQVPFVAARVDAMDVARTEQEWEAALESHFRAYGVPSGGPGAPG
ncbi:MAG: hypothetical protein RMM30_00555 [Armatimonadota bacterium]|nr:hypothetical protein [Armatimonadota bacterium]MDW8155067.1 hypothetical protein [Armatimonadota bacterium]